MATQKELTGPPPGTAPSPERDRVLACLRTNADEIRARGVRSLSLFGSTVRQEATPSSDADILIDLGEHHDLTLIDLVALENYLSGLLHAPVDLAICSNIKPFLRESILAEELRVF